MIDGFNPALDDLTAGIVQAERLKQKKELQFNWSSGKEGNRQRSVSNESDQSNGGSTSPSKSDRGDHEDFDEQTADLDHFGIHLEETEKDTKLVPEGDCRA